MKKDTGQFYLTFKRIKIRYRDPNNLGYFNHPFNSNNKMMLLDDIHLDKPLSETSLSTDFEGVDFSKKGKRTAKTREIIENTPQELFDFSKSI